MFYEEELEEARIQIYRHEEYEELVQTLVASGRNSDEVCLLIIILTEIKNQILETEDWEGWEGVVDIKGLAKYTRFNERVNNLIDCLFNKCLIDKTEDGRIKVNTKQILASKGYKKRFDELEVVRQKKEALKLALEQRQSEREIKEFWTEEKDTVFVDRD